MCMISVFFTIIVGSYSKLEDILFQPLALHFFFLTAKKNQDIIMLLPKKWYVALSDDS